MQANKNGFFYVLDRKTGKFISAKPYVPHNWASGLDPKTGRPIEHADIRYSETGKPVVMMPGPDGGHSWHPMAYNPNTGLVYIPAQEIGKSFTPVKDFKTSSIGWNLAVDVAGTPGAKKGYLLAWDPVKQKEAWRSDYIGPWNGGILDDRGKPRRPGRRRRQSERLSGGHRREALVALGPVSDHGRSGVVRGQRRAVHRRVVRLRLGASRCRRARSRRSRATCATSAASWHSRSAERRRFLRPRRSRSSCSTRRPRPPTRQPSAAGDGLFAQYCSVCHGENAVGGGVVPDLRASTFLGNDFFYEIVLNGAMKDAGMAPVQGRCSIRRTPPRSAPYVIQAG